MAGIHSMQPHERVNTMNGDPVQSGSLKNALNKFIGAEGVNTYSVGEALNMMMGNEDFSIRDARILLNKFLGVGYQTYTIQEALNVIEEFYPKTKADQELKTVPFDESGEITDIISDLPAQLVEQPCGVSVGTGKLTFTSLSGVTISSFNGTSTPTINGNDIEFSSGTIYDLVLSDGTNIPDPSTGYDISGNGNHGVVTDVTVGTQDDSAVIQSVGFNKYIKCLTNGTIRIKYEGAYTYRYYDYSTDTWSDESGTVTAGNYFELAIEAGDLAGLIKVDGVYPSQNVADWHVVSGSFENHLVPADIVNDGYDVFGNPLHYLPKGIIPLGAIEFNSDDTAPTPAKLRLYDRDNIIGATYEYWKPEIKLIDSYDATHPERHQLTEISADYIRVFGTQLLINRLFMKEYKNDSDWIAIQNILNFNELLSDADKVKVFRYLQDPSKSNQEAWELYQDSDVVASYRFDQPLSLFNEDGGLCKLGWEGEDIIVNGDFTTDSDWVKGTGWTITGGKLVGTATNDNTTQNGNIIANKKYLVTFTISDFSAGTVRMILGTTGIGTARGADGTFSEVIVAGNSTNLYIDGYATFTGKIDDISVIEIGNTCAKVLDVGSGGVDGLTYNNLTQSDLSLQGSRIAGGIELNANAEYDISATMNGKTCYIEEMDGTFTANFTVASSKITATEIYAEISSYKVKSLKLITS